MTGKRTPLEATVRRDGINVLPTGRNLYSVDPRAPPASWPTGCTTAERLLGAAERGMWEHPDPEILQDAYLKTEGDLEDDTSR